MHNLNKRLIRRTLSFIPLDQAKAAWATFRGEHGLKATAAPLLTAPDGNYKFAKTPVPVYGLSLAADKASEQYSVCDYSTPECRKGCVAYAGQGEAPNVQIARRVKTLFLAENPNAFITLLDHEILRATRKHDETIGVRLNAFSDLEWERIAPMLFEMHADVQFYDYTKRPFGSRVVPNNYHLTYSVSERTTDADIAKILLAGGNVAMVLDVAKHDDLVGRYLSLPVHVKGEGVVTREFPIIDGDASDARYVDASMGGESGVVIGLRPKGRMRKFPVGPNHMIREVQ